MGDKSNTIETTHSSIDTIAVDVSIQEASKTVRDDVRARKKENFLLRDKISYLTKKTLMLSETIASYFATHFWPFNLFYSGTEVDLCWRIEVARNVLEASWFVDEKAVNLGS
jgi:hypothetical protein